MAIILLKAFTLFCIRDEKVLDQFSSSPVVMAVALETVVHLMVT